MSDLKSTFAFIKIQCGKKDVRVKVKRIDLICFIVHYPEPDKVYCSSLNLKITTFELWQSKAQ